MLRKILVVLGIWFCFILQCTVFVKMSFAGIVPNLMIILTAAAGFMHSEEEGIIVGFLCGLLMDIFFGSYIGFFALVFMYIGFLNGKFNAVYYPEEVKLPLVLIISSDLTYGVICYLLLFMLRGKFEFVYYFTKIILPECIYTIVVAFVLYPVILLIDSRFSSTKRGAGRFVR